MKVEASELVSVFHEKRKTRKEDRGELYMTNILYLDCLFPFFYQKCILFDDQHIYSIKRMKPICFYSIKTIYVSFFFMRREDRGRESDRERLERD